MPKAAHLFTPRKTTKEYAHLVSVEWRLLVKGVKVVLKKEAKILQTNF